MPLLEFTQGLVVDNKYTIERLLGSGGMSSVYAAYQQELARPVVVKFINATVSKDMLHYKRLHREAKAMSSLMHPNIVSFYGYGVWEGFPYLVLEMVRGITLDSLLEPKEPLPLTQTFQIMRQLCQALSHAHRMGIVHRDLKPANIMLSTETADELTVKVIDFGLAKLLPEFGSEVQKLTQTGTAIGSVLYMSPEQCRGEAIDQRTDIYSVGAILHHLLTGNPPFPKDNSFSIMQAHIAEAPPKLSISQSQARYPEALQLVLYKAMAKRPEDRYASIDNLMEDLRRIEAGEALLTDVDAKIASAPVRSSSKGTSSRMVTLLLALSIFAVFVLGLTHQFRQASEGPDARDMYYALKRAQEKRTFAEGDPTVVESDIQAINEILKANESDHSLDSDRKNSPIGELYVQLLQCYFTFGKFEQGWSTLDAYLNSAGMLNFEQRRDQALSFASLGLQQYRGWKEDASYDSNVRKMSSYLEAQLNKGVANVRHLEFSEKQVKAAMLHRLVTFQSSQPQRKGDFDRILVLTQKLRDCDPYLMKQIWLTMGSAYLGACFDPKLADVCYGEVRKLASAEPDDVSWQTYLTLADGYAVIGNWGLHNESLDRTKQIIERLISANSKEMDVAGQQAMLRRLRISAARSCFAQGKIAQGWKEYEKLMALPSMANDSAAHRDILFQITRGHSDYMGPKNPPEFRASCLRAIDLATRQLELVVNSPPTDPAEKRVILNLLHRLTLTAWTSQVDRARVNRAKAVALRLTWSNDGLLIRSWNLLMSCYLASHDLVNARDCCEHLEKLAESQKPELACWTYLQACEGYLDLTDWKKYDQCFAKMQQNLSEAGSVVALSYVGPLGEHNTDLSIYNIQERALFLRGRYQQAWSYFERVINQPWARDDPAIRSFILLQAARGLTGASGDQLELNKLKRRLSKLIEDEVSESRKLPDNMPADRKQLVSGIRARLTDLKATLRTPAKS